MLPVITFNGIQSGTRVLLRNVTSSKIATYFLTAVMNSDYEGVEVTAVASFADSYDIEPKYESIYTNRPLRVYCE